MTSGSSIAIDARLVEGQSGGDSTYWTGLVRGLTQVDSEFQFLLISNRSRPAGIPDCARLRWIRVSSRSSRWWSLVQFPLAARRFRARGIHTQYSLSPLAGRRGITTIHDVSFFIEPRWFKLRDGWLLRRSVPSSARRAAQVITVSEASKSELVRCLGIDAGRVSVTPLAPGPNIYPLSSSEAAQELSALHVTTPIMLTAGTRSPRKNMGLAIEMMNHLPKHFPHKLILAGRFDWGPELLTSRVSALGYVSDRALSALYSTADLYVAPSLHEGFGIPVLEAFVCQCPVLCSSGGALPEVAGGAAVVEQSWAPAQWAETASTLLDDSGTLEAMRQRGLERSAHFSWPRTAEMTLDVYRRVAFD